MKRISSRPLYRWLPVYIILVLALVVGLGAIALQAVESQMISNRGQSLAQGASDIADKLDLVLFERYNHFQQMANAPVLRGQDVRAKQDYLQMVERIYPRFAYLWLAVTNPDGQVIASSHPPSVGNEYIKTPWFQEVLERQAIVVGDVRPSYEAGGMDAVSFTGPLFDSAGTFLGALTARIGVSWLEEVVTGTLVSDLAIRDGGSLPEYQVLRKDGFVFMDADLLHKGLINLENLGLPSVRASQSARAGFVEEIHRRRDVSVITGYAKTEGYGEFKGLDWRVLLRVDRENVLAPIRELLWKVGGVGAVGILPLVGILVWTTTRLRQEWRQAQEEQARATAAEANYRSLLESTEDGIYGIDRQGRITFVNHAAGKMLGFTYEELIDQHAHRLFHYSRPDGSSYPDTACPIYAVLRNGEPCRVEEDLFWKKDGSGLSVAYTSSPIRADEEVTGAVVIFGDITERQKAKQRLRVQHAATRILATSDSIERAVGEILRVVCTGLQWDVALFWERDKEANVLRCSVGWTRLDAKLQAFKEGSREFSFGAGVGLPGRIWKLGHAAWITDVWNDENFPRWELARQAGLHGAFGFPIILEGETLGIVELFTRESHEPDEAFKFMMINLGNHVGQFIDRVHELERRRSAEEQLRQVNEQLEQRVEQRTAQLQGLSQASLGIMNAQSSIQDLLQIITEEARRIIGVNQAVTSLVSEGDWNQALHAVSSSETSHASRPSEGRAAGSGLEALVCDPNRPRRLTQKEVENQIEERGAGRQADRMAFLRGWLGAPLRAGDGRNIGLIQLTDKYDGEEFTATDEVVLVQLAQMASVAVENARLYEETYEAEQRLRQYATDLETANKELEAFSYSVSHDLRAPLRGIDGFSQALLEDYSDQLDKMGRDHLQRVRAGAKRMGQLIDDLLALSRLSRSEMQIKTIDLTTMAWEILADLQKQDPERSVEVDVGEHLTAKGDPRLIRVALENLLGNAWKFSGTRERARIEVNAQRETDGESTVFYVRDNGVGFDMAHVDKLFGAFQRLHGATEFPGTGIGLATVRRIINRHGGRIWAESALGQGTTFFFTLGGSD